MKILPNLPSMVGSARPHLAGFRTLDREVDLASVTVSGKLPEWLRGTIVRNGPARFELDQESYRHWFDGLAMLHRFTLDGAANTVSYANKFLRGQDYERSMAKGRVHCRTFATDPCRSIFSRLAGMFFPEVTDNASINVARLADRYVAMTETPLPVEFDLDTLETRGSFTFDDNVSASTDTAHPHYDFASRKWYNHGLRFGRKSAYLITETEAVAPGQARRRVLSEIPVDDPGYMHSFGLSENYAIIVEGPLVVSPLSILLSDKPFIDNFRWEPARGARFFVVDRRDGTWREHRTDAFFVFHHVNAFEQDGELMVDLCAYPDNRVIDALFLDKLRAGEHVPTAELRRFAIPLASGGEIEPRALSDQAVELPRINYQRCTTRPYRYVYGTSEARGTDGQPIPGEFLNQLVKVDVAEGTSIAWRQPGLFPGEGVFVPAPGAEQPDSNQPEDDGVVLSVVLDAQNNSSSLLVLDARDFTELACAHVPHAIPFGFHGQFFAN